MLTAGKVWGRTISLFQKNNVELHRIEVRAGGYCSKHYHNHKWNAFFIEDGCLEISVWKRDTGLCDVTRLGSGEMMYVPPGEYHRFRGVAPLTKAYEIYWVELSSSDIERRESGGASDS